MIFFILFIKQSNNLFVKNSISFKFPYDLDLTKFPTPPPIVYPMLVHRMSDGVLAATLAHLQHGLLQVTDGG